MILEQIPTEWFIKNYIEYDDDKTYISLKSPKKVVDYFKEIDSVYFKDNGIHFLFFDNHDVLEKVKIPKDFPKYMGI